MEQPSIPNTSPQKPTKKKPPTPQELISHYQTKGLNTEEASLKVIEDLQNVLFKVISSTKKNRNEKFMTETSRKIDGVSSRVAVVDMKLDSKPGYFESFVLGIGSVAAFKGIETCVWPHVVGGFGQILSSVKEFTNPPSSST